MTEKRLGKTFTQFKGQCVVHLSRSAIFFSEWRCFIEAQGLQVKAFLIIIKTTNPLISL